MNKKIVHYLFRDVFCTGYINFMVDSMAEYDHIFIMKRKAKVFKHGIKSNKADIIHFNSKAKVLFIDEDHEMYDNPIICEHIQHCSKIIISGLFDDLTYLLKYPDDIWEKIFLHFWGGDFYCYRSEKMEDAPQRRLQQRGLLIDAIRRCAAVLTVVDTDYKHLSSILDVSKLHFEAAMPENLELSIDYERYKKEFYRKNGDPLRIVIGNSAASDNCHLEIFKKLEWLSGENVEIFCPLSYGEIEYRETVIYEGRQIFGEQITFLHEFMDIDKYTEFLASCDIGIYNNNRQQGFKNITMMLCLGKKVFLRENTATWNKLKKLGTSIYSIREFDQHDMSVFQSLDSITVEKNKKCMEYFKESYKGQWEYILNDRSREIYIKRCTDLVVFNIHLTDHCNLRCKGCSHFAPVASQFYLSEESLKDTLILIKNLPSGIIKELSLMGGEPFLHPKLDEFLVLCRRYLENTPIKIVTNGLKIKELEDKFWDICRECSVEIEITCYPINVNYQELLEYVKNKNVTVHIYADRRDGEFRRDKLDPEGKYNIAENYSKCRIGGLYPQIRDDKLFRCAIVANIHILNKAFNTDFTYNEEDYLLLSSVENAETIRDFLASPAPFCRYCNLKEQHFERWEISQMKQEEWL